MRIPILALLLTMGLSLAALAQAERITDFSSVVEVLPNGDLIVTETISVVAAGLEIKRGIYRDFPTRYPTHYGLQRKVGFQVEQVLRDGKPEPWVTNLEAISNGVRVFIGDANTFLDPGEYTYTLQYRTNRQIVTSGEADELYWNVTGNGWMFPIEKASARVELPPGASFLSAEAYTGPAGTKGHLWHLAPSSSPEAPVLETTAPLAPHEGFTISVTWPKGFLDPGANPDTLARLIDDNRSTLWSLLLLVPVVLYYLTAWFFLGRDPPGGVIIPHYGPPKGFTPAAVRFVAGFGRIDNKSFAAAVLQLAVRGALRIIQNKTFTLVKTGKDAGILPGQKKFLQALFGGRQELEMKPSNHSTFQAARRELAKWLKADFEKAYFVRNTAVYIPGILLSLIPAGLSLLDSPNALLSLFLLVFLAIWTQGVSGLISSALSQLRTGNWLAGLPMLVLALPFLAAWIVGIGFLLFTTSLWVTFVFLSGASLNLLFYHLLKAPTLQGRAILDHIEGFKHYLGVAESERLNLENPPDRTPALFEQFLPFALALNVEQRWAEQFSDVLSAENYQPQWFTGSSLAAFSATGLSSSLGGAMTSAIAASSTAPGSSGGSGGGGSSGGGGGGGGGGGW